MLVRGRFGVEYNPRQLERKPAGLGCLFALVALVAAVSLVWALVRRSPARGDDVASGAEPAPPPAAEPAPPEPAPSEPARQPILSGPDYSRRPPRVRNLLMRLEEAERARDVEMAVTTIEAIRGLSGSPAADLDDALARRLGALNVRRLLDGRSAQWVKVVTARRGDSASRLAAENGSTPASLARLNGGDVGRIAVGQRLYVMDHPRFSLAVRRRTRTADLSLNGKFFKRYDLREASGGRNGAFELPERGRRFLAGLGVTLSDADAAELEMLLPVGTPVLVSEM